MAHLTISEIARVLESGHNPQFSNATVSRLLLDSRQFSSADGVLFFALRGKNHDGHGYIHHLVQKGVKYFVVEEIPPQIEGVSFIKVEDSLAALQRLAHFIREKSTAKIVAITGSNGKTVVKEWLAQILQKQYSVCRSPKSYNSQIGVPLSIWELEPHHQVGIFEAGISEPCEMEKLEAMLSPEFGIFTNIGSAHEANFENRQQKINEKLKLFTDCKKLVYEEDGSERAKHIKSFAEKNSVELLSWSRYERPADINARIETFADGSKITVNQGGEEWGFTIPFADEASVQNAMHCLRMAVELGISKEILAETFSRLSPVEMRLQMKSGSSNNLIINDAYNSDLESLRVALHYLDHHAGKRERVLVLSDMLQTGLDEKQLSQEISEVINRFELHRVIAIGPQLSLHGLQIKAQLDLYSDTEEFLENRFRYHIKDSAILLKGARPFAFEKISQLLEEQSHETVLNIYMNRMVHNLNYFRAKLKPKTKLMAMVKAFSYGSGSYEVANLLQFHKVDYLGVAYADEGVALRKAGISLPILVLNAEPSAFHDLVNFRLEPEIYGFHQLKSFQEVVAREGLNEPFPIHLKLETGMHRLGFEESQLKDMLELLQQTNVLKVVSAFSHLAASDDAAERDFTLGQIQKFERMTEVLQHGLGYEFIRHISNSGGISNYPEAHFDMVRLGVGLYGIGSNENDRQHLQVASELLATVSQVKQVEAGESVGYGRSFVADYTMSIAVVSIGYADGFRRSLSNGVGEVSIRGKRYPVVGRVCMDMVMIDVTDSDVQEGDKVEVFGQTISVYELSQKMDTIPYEVLTGISHRVKRVYFME